MFKTRKVVDHWPKVDEQIPYRDHIFLLFEPPPYKKALILAPEKNVHYMLKFYYYVSRTSLPHEDGKRHP
jgi:hypothetical protein